jgi:hypothetical protein
MANSQYSMSSQGSNVDSYINFDDDAIGQDDNVDGKQSFKNLYWSSVISLQRWQLGEVRRRPIGPDVKEETDLYADLEVDDQDGWVMHFNPIEFNNLHKPLKFEQYRLTQE